MKHRELTRRYIHETFTVVFEHDDPYGTWTWHASGIVAGSIEWDGDLDGDEDFDGFDTFEAARSSVARALDHYQSEVGKWSAK